MIVITDRRQIAAIADPQLQHLVELRIRSIEECCPWDAQELGPIIIVEPGDIADDLETFMGFSILEGILDGSHFPDEEFSPSFEFCELVGDDLFELIYVVSDGGYGYDIFIINRPAIDPVLLAFCQRYAEPNPHNI